MDNKLELEDTDSKCEGEGGLRFFGHPNTRHWILFLIILSYGVTLAPYSWLDGTHLRNAPLLGEFM